MKSVIHVGIFCCIIFLFSNGSVTASGWQIAQYGVQLPQIQRLFGAPVQRAMSTRCYDGWRKEREKNEERKAPIMSVVRFHGALNKYLYTRGTIHHWQLKHYWKCGNNRSKLLTSKDIA